MLKLHVGMNGESELIKLEHSLFSLSKWEAEKEKPFFPSSPEATISQEDMVDYFAYMILDRDDEEQVVRNMTADDFMKITEYINSSRTATTVREIQNRKPGPKENVSSELMYYWMISFSIPFECDKWHLNRLITLIRVCSVKNAKPEKKSAKQRAQEMRDLNEERKKKFGTSG